MPTIEHIKKDIAFIETVGSISGLLLEIGALQIRNLRKDFEHNELFFKEISELYNVVKTSAVQQASTKNQRKDGNKQASGKDRKIAAIAITSNKRFHGSLNRKVIDTFLTRVDGDTTHCVIIGETGKKYVESTSYYAKSEFITFHDDYPTPGEVQSFLEKIAQYDQVFLYYPQFVTIFAQEVGIVDITHTPQKKVSDEKQIEYIFEPELPKIIEFFETQVRQLLFVRIMLESELARISARLVKMSTTEERAHDIVKEKEGELRKELSILNDVQLLESFKQWKK